MRTFDSGATRDTDDGKLDFEGFLSPEVLYCYSEYMHRHRTQADGSLRDSDNWQKGMPKAEYLKSLLRHAFAAWRKHRISSKDESIQEDLCGVLFNAMGYLYQTIKQTHKAQKNAEMTSHPVDLTAQIPGMLVAGTEHHEER